MSEGSRSEVGTEITLYLNEDCLEFCNGYKAREVIKKYCSFMPYEIYLSVANTTATQTINADEKLDTDTVIETIAPEKEGDPEKVKIAKRPELLNDTTPLWTKNPSECTKDEYLEFYRKVFQDYKEPLFWIHLNMDYPFNLKGILYFPKINMEYESIEGTIKLYNSQVFIADNIKEVIPEFLMLLKGVIDCPDLPLNVSRSALQNDGFVKKISDYITKKVADKLAGLCRTEKEEYQKYWDDISPFIKFGCLKDDKFCEKMTDYILFKNIDGEYRTLPECLEVKPTDTEQDEESGAAKADGESADADGNKDGAADGGSTGAESTATDVETGEAVETEVVTDQDSGEDADFDEEDEDGEPDEKKEKVIYYVTDEVQQSQYINMFRKAKMDAVILKDNIDQPFISQLESKNEGIRFKRIDADITDDFKAKTSKKAAEELAAQSEELNKLFKKAIKKDNVTVKLEKLKNKDISSMVTLSEETRRMQDMMKMYAMPGMGMPGMGKEGLTLTLNANNKLVRYILDHKDGENVGIICEQLYDLALIQQAPLEPEAMTKFVARSNQIMMLLAQ